MINIPGGNPPREEKSKIKSSKGGKYWSRLDPRGPSQQGAELEKSKRGTSYKEKGSVEQIRDLFRTH